mgnify:CR=1 FL=1
MRALTRPLARPLIPNSEPIGCNKLSVERSAFCSYPCVTLPALLWPCYSARVAIHPPTIAVTVTEIHTHGCPKVAHVNPIPSIKVVIAAILARRDIARRSRQSMICGPHVGWSRILRSHLGLLRAKQNVANNRKGTVGKSGKTAPTAPNAVQITPAARYSRRMF